MNFCKGSAVPLCLRDGRAEAFAPNPQPQHPKKKKKKERVKNWAQPTTSQYFLAHVTRAAN